MKTIANHRLLRIAALIAGTGGALGSVCLTLWVGRGNDSRFLVALFTIWVLSPFVALGLACVVSRRWTAPAQKKLYGITLALTLCSLFLYGLAALGPRMSKPAFMFLVVPLASWLLIAITAAIIALRRKKDEGA